MDGKPGTVITSIQELIDILQKVQYEYGNDAEIKIVDPVRPEYCGRTQFRGIAKDGTIILEGLFIRELYDI